MADRTVTLRLESGASLPGEDALHVAAEVRVPQRLLPGAPALVCLPGGGMTRRYYDLVPAEDSADTSFSFSRQMAQRGFISILIDYLGVGESDRPADGYALTPERLNQVNACALDQIMAQLREGSLLEGLAPLPELRTLGVGHSMGAMFTVLQQAQYRQHAGIALLGFSTRGLPEYLIPEARELAGDADAARRELVRLARATFNEPYPVIKPTQQSAGIYAGGNAEARGAQAVRAAMTHLLPVPAFMSMLPGNVAPEAARIEVPVFLGIGSKDLVGPTHVVPAAFPASPDVDLHILPQTGHSHFLFPARARLFERLGAWASTISSSPQP
jgi:pimeloyl-ACP methyl ester carboxylesterase